MATADDNALNGGIELFSEHNHHVDTPGVTSNKKNPSSKGPGPSDSEPRIDGDGFTTVGRKGSKKPRKVYQIIVHSASGKTIPWVHLSQFASSLSKSLGYLPSCRRQSRGTEAVFSVFNEKHAEVSRTYYEEFGLVKGHRNKTLRGFVGGLPLDLDCAEILESCRSVGVSGVTPLEPVQAYGKRKAFSRKVVLSFTGVTKLPERVNIGPLCLDIRPYKESNVTCYRCRKSGHYANVCKTQMASQARPGAPRQNPGPSKPKTKAGNGLSYAQAAKPKSFVSRQPNSELKSGEGRVVKNSVSFAARANALPVKAKKIAANPGPKKLAESNAKCTTSTKKLPVKCSTQGKKTLQEPAPRPTERKERPGRSVEEKTAQASGQAAALEPRMSREDEPVVFSPINGTFAGWLDDGIRLLSTFHALQNQKLTDLLRNFPPEVSEEIGRCIDQERFVTDVFARHVQELTAFISKAIDVAQPQVV